MKTSRVVLYNRPAKEGKKKTTKEKFPRAICLYQTLIEKKYKDADSFLLLSTELYDEKNEVAEKKQGATWESFRIWRIITPVLLKLEVEIPDYLL